MHKFSVKKPLTVFVAVIAVLVLGVVAYFRMTPDLLPNMDFPYVVIMTTYPGASPEKVESEVTKPLEQSMSTLENIKEISSTSQENVSLVMLEFNDSVNTDTIGVDIQQQIAILSAAWEDTVGTPYVLKINPSMLPVEVAALSMDGMDNVQLAEFLNDTLMNKLEGIPGVARITTTGMIQQELHVVLDQSLIDAANEKVIAAINKQLDDAAAELEDQKEELEDSKAQMESAQGQMSAGVDAILEGDKRLDEEKKKLLAAKEEISAAKAQLETTYTALKTILDQVNEVVAIRDDAVARVNTLQSLQEQAAQIQQLEAQIQAIDQQIAEAEGSELEELQAQKIQLEADLAIQQATLSAGLAAAGTTEEGLDAALVEAKLNAELAEQGVAAIAQLLATQDMDIETLRATVAELEAQRNQLIEAEKQLDAGLLSLEEAEALLEEQKLKGLIQMSTAAGKLAAGASSLEMALTQIETGLDTIEDSREDALRQADLNEIITMEMVQQILTAQNFAMPAGYVQEDGINYMVSVGDEITDLDTLQNLLLFDMGLEGVEPIYLKDVAVVTLTDNQEETYAKLDGQDSVMLRFEKQSTYSTAGTTENINSRFRELEEEYPGLHFVSMMDQGDYIYMVVNSILKNLFLGALFSVLILFLFLRDLRPTVITLCAIPISVVFAIVLMYFSGVTLNMISMSGLAIAVGMLVDNSVVVIENIYRLRAKGANAIQAAVSGAGQVVGAVTASTLTTVCVFLPIVFVEGITRQIFTDLALTMTYALLASLIISLTLVPAMASGMLKQDKPIREGRLWGTVMKGYRSSVNWALKHKTAVLILAAVLLVVSMVLSLSRGFIFMPSLDSSTITVSVTMPEDANMDTAAALADDVLERVGSIEGVESVGAMMGSTRILSAGSGDYNVTLYVNLSSDKMSGAAVAKQIEENCAGMACSVSATSAMMDMSMFTGSGISLDLYADDMQALQNAARETAQLLNQLEGVKSVSDGMEDAAPALHVAIDRNKAMKHGLTIAQVYMELVSRITANGTAVSLELDGISTDVIIEKPAGAVLDAQGLRDYVFEITNSEGEIAEVPLSDFAVVEETTSLDTISRLNQRRLLTVTATVEDGYNVTLVTREAEKLMEKADLGDGITYSFNGENEMILEALEQLLLMLVLGLLLVYLVMVAQFQSLKSPFIVMFTIPLAFTGGFFGLLMAGMEVSVIAMIGFIMLMGVIVNNGIVLVDYINQLRLGGMERREAIVEAGVVRMRPILMTTLTTVLGQLVMVISTDAGSIMMRPIAVVCIGGLLYATLMTLFVIPCIYDMMNKKALRQVREEDLKILDI